MLRCALPLAFGLGLFVGSADAQEAKDPPLSPLRAQMRDALKAKVQDKPAVMPAPAETAASDAAPVKMAPFVVEEKRAPRTAGLDEAMQKERALEPRAFYHADLTKKVRLEIGLPPERGGKGGGFALPLLRLSW